MKKITLSVALLLFGGGYFANAQVGINTPTPATSSMLEIKAEDKGVLIPRIALTSTIVFTPVTGTEVESLLVYNTATAGDAAAKTNVTPGFYYWVKEGVTTAHWERIVNQTQLDEAIENVTNLQGDVDKILALLKVAFPSNNLVNPVTDGTTHGGGMVFTPGDGTATQSKIEYVYFDGTNYVTKDITADIIDIIKGVESKTTVLQYPAASGKYYYISEETIQGNDGNVPDTPYVGDDDTAALRPGVVLLDVPASVVKNFQTIVEGTTTILKPGGTTNEYYTVKEYIQYLSSLVDGNVVYKQVQVEGESAGTMEWVFQYWDATDEEYKTIKLGDIVKANETRTSLARSENNGDYTEVIADPKALTKVTYEYSPENGDKNYIDVTADILYSVNNNEEVKNAISNILNLGGNVYYTENAIAENTATGQVAIPAKSLFIIEIVGGKEVKTPIDISGTVLQAITNNSETIKNLLGDKISNTTVTKTGDTFNGGDVYIYTNTTDVVHTDSNATRSAVTTGITIPNTVKPGTVIGIKVIDDNGIASNVTDVEITGQKIDFNIGTGNHYTTLPVKTGYNVIVEFVGTTVVTNP